MNSPEDEWQLMYYRYIIVICKRAFHLKLYDEIYQLVFKNYDAELWRSFKTVTKFMDMMLYVGKKERFL